VRVQSGGVGVRMAWVHRRCKTAHGVSSVESSGSSGSSGSADPLDFDRAGDIWTSPISHKRTRPSELFCISVSRLTLRVRGDLSLRSPVGNIVDVSSRRRLTLRVAQRSALIAQLRGLQRRRQPPEATLYVHILLQSLNLILRITYGDDG